MPRRESKPQMDVTAAAVTLASALKRRGTPWREALADRRCHGAARLLLSDGPQQPAPRSRASPTRLCAQVVEGQAV